MQGWVCGAGTGMLGVLLLLTGFALLGERDTIVETVVKAALDLTNAKSLGFRFFVRTALLQLYHKFTVLHRWSRQSRSRSSSLSLRLSTMRNSSPELTTSLFWWSAALTPTGRTDTSGTSTGETERMRKNDLDIFYSV